MADTQPTEAEPASSTSQSPSFQWQPLVVTFDNKLLSGYSKDTVIRLGKGSFAGTKTTARCIWGPHVPPHIEIEVNIQDGTEETHVLRATVKLQLLKAPAEYIVLNSSETDTLNRYLPFEEQDLGGLRNGRIDRRDTNQFDELTFASSDPTIAEYLPALGSDIVNIRFDVKKGDMIVLTSPWLVSNMQHYPPAVQTHMQAIIDAFEMHNTGSSTILFAFPAGNEWKNSWNGAFEHVSHLTPFCDICRNVHGTIDDLTLKNLDLSNLQQPVRSNPATDMFLSRDHRTVALIVGSAEELAYQRYREDKLYSINIQGCAFADPTSIVQPSDKDVDSYGIRMDGVTMMHQFIAIPLAGIRELCPDVGTQVSMYLNVPHQTHPGAISNLGDAFRGVRIPLPYGIRADIALFSVHTPRQAKWIRGFERPPEKYLIPMTPLTEDLQTTFANLFDDRGRGTQQASTFTLRIWSEESDTTTIQECRAVTGLNSVGEDTNVGKWWKHIIDFTQPELMDTGNLFIAFPELAARVQRGEYDNDPDTKAAMESLQVTKAGIVTVTGCPGSGKSTWATEVCDAVMHGPPIQPGWLSSTQTTSVNDIDAGDPATEPATPQGWNSAPGWKAALTDGIHATEINEVGQNDAQSQVTSGRCVWVTPTDQLANDACQRLGRKSADMRIMHVFPWEREVSNVLNEDASMPEGPSEEAIQHLPHQEFAIVQHLARYKISQWRKTSPAADPNSLSEIAKDFAKSNPEEFADAIRAIYEFNHDNGTFKKNLAKNRQSIRELLEFVLGKADSIIGTPVAISELMDHIKSWRPDLVVVDEAARLTEAALMIPVLNFVGVPMLILGDTKQCTPFSRTDDAKSFNDLFGKQRKTSFLDRVSHADAFHITLTANHRAHGSVADWPLKHFYHGRMAVVNGRSQATREYHGYLQSLKEPPAECNSIFLDVQCGQEEKVGTSFINPTNALIVRELAVQLFRDAPIRNMVDYVKHLKNENFPVRRGTVMIITGYTNQKRQYESIIESISPAEIPSGHLTVRTIDDSVSAEADIVIVDLVRTTRVGFMDDPKRVAVMTTRARLGQIFVGNGATFQWQKHLGSLFQTLLQRKCVIEINPGGKGWGTWCARCHQSGHEVTACQASPVCFRCEQDGRESGHSIRNCPNPVEPSEYYDGPIGELDNVHRNIIRFEKPGKFGGGRRVKLQQKRQRPRGIQPQREESAAEKRYRELMWAD